MKNFAFILLMLLNSFSFSQTKEQYASVDFKYIENEDSDNDKVNDLKDNCPGTPESVKVDKKGCPLDSDNDGIADYMDKEPNTPKGSIVDTFGATLKYDDRTEQRQLPDIYEAIDKNKNDKIEVEEITMVIDDFFDNKSTLKQQDIYNLVDYFFGN
jgi:hypothetical protein